MLQLTVCPTDWSLVEHVTWTLSTWHTCCETPRTVSELRKTMDNHWFDEHDETVCDGTTGHTTDEQVRDTVRKAADMGLIAGSPLSVTLLGQQHLRSFG